MRNSLLLEKFDAFIKEKEKGQEIAALFKSAPELLFFLSEFLFDLGLFIGNKYLSVMNVVESLPEGVCLLDESGNVTYTSLIGAKLLGKDSSELLGVNFLSEYYRDSVEIDYESHSLEGKLCWISHPDGTSQPVILRFRPLKSNDTTLLGKIVTISDASHLIEKEEILKKSRDQAIEQYKQKSNFLATVSHEIRTPINGILCLANLLGMQEDISSQMKEDITDLELSAKSLSLMINSVLDLSKIEAGKILIDKKSTFTQLFIRDIEQDHKSIFKSKNQYFFIHSEDNLPSLINIDPLRVNQIVSNFLSNASKFTPTNGCIMMYFKSYKDSLGEDFLEISIADTGIGIAETNIKNLFCSYSQLDNSITRAYGGTGLGLAICEKMADILNGRLEVKSRPGIGSVFKVIFPIEILNHNDSTTKEAKISPKVTPISNNIKNILAIDDNRINLQTLTRLLQARGYKVFAVNDPTKVNDILKGTIFDLILTDIHMPSLSGDKLARNIREALGVNVPPIVAITADNNPLFKSEYEGIFDDVLLKPIDFVGLYRVIDSIN